MLPTPTLCAILAVSLWVKKGTVWGKNEEFGENSFHFSNVNLKHFVKGAAGCAGCHSLIDLEKVSCRLLPLHATLFLRPICLEALSENCKGKSDVVVVLCWYRSVRCVGVVGCLCRNDKLSTHFSFIFNTFDWYIEHLAHNLSNSLWLKWLLPHCLCYLCYLCTLFCQGVYSTEARISWQALWEHFPRMSSISHEPRCCQMRPLHVKCCDKGESSATRTFLAVNWSGLYFKLKCVLHFLIGWTAVSPQLDSW